jgi:hypothetical protein
MCLGDLDDRKFVLLDRGRLGVGFLGAYQLLGLIEVSQGIAVQAREPVIGDVPLHLLVLALFRVGSLRPVLSVQPEHIGVYTGRVQDMMKALGGIVKQRLAGHRCRVLLIGVQILEVICTAQKAYKQIIFFMLYVILLISYSEAKLYFESYTSYRWV